VSCVMDVMAPYLAHVSSAQSVQTMISAHPVEVQDSTMNINSQAFRIHLSRYVYDFVLDWGRPSHLRRAIFGPSKWPV